MVILQPATCSKLPTANWFRGWLTLWLWLLLVPASAAWQGRVDSRPWAPVCPPLRRPGLPRKWLHKDAGYREINASVWTNVSIDPISTWTPDQSMCSARRLRRNMPRCQFRAPMHGSVVLVCTVAFSVTQQTYVEPCVEPNQCTATKSVQLHTLSTTIIDSLTIACANQSCF